MDCIWNFIMLNLYFLQAANHLNCTQSLIVFLAGIIALNFHSGPDSQVVTLIANQVKQKVPH